jgi:hypothetical protein
MTDKSMPAIERLRVDAVQLAHAGCQLPARCFDEKMEMVGHQAVSMYREAKPCADHGQNIEPKSSIVVVNIDTGTTVPTCCDMVECACEFDAEWTGHRNNVASKTMGRLSGINRTKNCRRDGLASLALCPT